MLKWRTIIKYISLCYEFRFELIRNMSYYFEVLVYVLGDPCLKLQHIGDSEIFYMQTN